MTSITNAQSESAHSKLEAESNERNRNAAPKATGLGPGTDKPSSTSDLPPTVPGFSKRN